MPSQFQPPTGMAEAEGVLAATQLELFTVPAAWMRDLVAYVRMLEGRHE